MVNLCTVIVKCNQFTWRHLAQEVEWVGWKPAASSSVKVSLNKTPHELAVALYYWHHLWCVNMCMNWWMLANIVTRFEWPRVRKALCKCSPFTNPFSCYFPLNVRLRNYAWGPNLKHWKCFVVFCFWPQGRVPSIILYIYLEVIHFFVIWMRGHMFQAQTVMASFPINTECDTRTRTHTHKYTHT
jgi:hypothetical protein